MHTSSPSLSQDIHASLAAIGGTDFSSRVIRARAFYRSMVPDIAAGLRSQTDAEESAIRSLTAAGYDYTCSREAVLS
jgi:hypothetical protein